MFYDSLEVNYDISVLLFSKGKPMTIVFYISLEVNYDISVL